MVRNGPTQLKWRHWLASAPPKRHDTGQRESKAGDLGRLQTVLATAWPAARQRDKQHVPPSSISGQEQAAENDQEHTHESHRRTEAIWREDGLLARLKRNKVDFSVKLKGPKTG
jgi:hypothetical protein